MPAAAPPHHHRLDGDRGIVRDTVQMFGLCRFVIRFAFVISPFEIPDMYTLSFLWEEAKHPGETVLGNKGRHRLTFTQRWHYTTTYWQHNQKREPPENLCFLLDLAVTPAPLHVILVWSLTSGTCISAVISVTKTQFQISLYTLRPISVKQSSGIELKTVLWKDDNLATIKSD